jgi:Tfp pilus assembly protein PilV
MTSPVKNHASSLDAASDSEAGVSLIEVLIYMVLSVLVLGIVGAILINGLRTEAAVRTADVSASGSQLVMASIQRGVDNATDLAVIVPDGHDLDQVVIIRTANGAATPVYSCQAWYYSNAEHTIRTETSPDGVAVSTDNPLSWTLLAQGVAPGATGTIFTEDGTSLDIDFTVTAEYRDPINIHSSARSLSDSREASSCT